MEREEYRRMFEAEEAHWWYAGMRAICDGLLAARPRTGSLLLDAGCGTGGNLQHLQSRWRAIGIDASDEALRFCRARGVTAAQGRLEQLPFADSTFDCVTCLDVLYHRNVDERRAVEELARVLKPNGTLLVRVPALPLLWRAHDRAVHTRHRYRRSELVRLLAGAGLEVLRASYCNTLLLPLVAGRAAVDRALHQEGSDLASSHSWLAAPLRAEAWLLRHIDLPIGSSVFALASKR